MRTTTLLLLGTVISLACAFTPSSTNSRLTQTSTAPMLSRVAPLHMSDVPSSDWKDSLPPSPEDQLIMTGDIAALFVYSFLDHSLNEQFVLATLQGNTELWDPFGELASSQIPVWFDALHSTQSQEFILSILNLPQIYYSPIINTAGTASVLLTSCWLLSGWLSGAFLFRNTLECNTTRALLKTFQTWAWTCLVMIALCGASNHFFGGMEGMALTKADADYIFDSFTVLVTWRFLVSLMLGNNTRD